MVLTFFYQLSPTNPAGLSYSFQGRIKTLLGDCCSGYLCWVFEIDLKVALGVNAANGRVAFVQYSFNCLGLSCRCVVVEVLHARLFSPPAHWAIQTHICQGLLICCPTFHLNCTGDEFWSVIGTRIAIWVVYIFLALGGSYIVAEGLRFRSRLIVTHPMAMAFSSTEAFCSRRMN